VLAMAQDPEEDSDLGTARHGTIISMFFLHKKIDLKLAQASL
jgi:hypothetical protein